MVDGFPFNGIGVGEGVADADEGEAGDEAEEGGMGDAGLFSRPIPICYLPVMDIGGWRA